MIADAAPVVSHFPPRCELERTILTVAYLAYRPELDALAGEGVHAYLERELVVARGSEREDDARELAAAVAAALNQTP